MLDFDASDIKMAVEATRLDAKDYLETSGGDPSKLLLALLRLIVHNDMEFMEMQEDPHEDDPVAKGKALATGTSRVTAAAQVFATPLIKSGREAFWETPVLGQRQTPDGETPVPSAPTDSAPNEMDEEWEFARMAAYAEAEDFVDAIEPTGHDLSIAMQDMAHGALKTAQIMVDAGDPMAALNLFGHTLTMMGTVADVFHNDLEDAQEEAAKDAGNPVGKEPTNE